MGFEKGWSAAFDQLVELRQLALRAVTKEVVGIRVLLTRSPFGGGIPRRLASARFSSDTDFCSLAILIAAQNEASFKEPPIP
jgi:hypothetical protein